jgi:signal transduction histidine kinase
MTATVTGQQCSAGRMQRSVSEVEQQLIETTHRLQRTVAELERKNEEVEAFVYIVSHDLRAPLVNVQGFSRELEFSCSRLKALLHSCGIPEPQRDSVDEIMNQEIADALRFISASSSKFERLIDALLGLSRQGRQVYRPEWVNVRKLVESSVASMQMEIDDAGATVEVGDVPPTFADVTALGRVFSNLLSNCIKYLDPTRPLHVEVGGRVEDGFLHYWVSDNGVGIPHTGQARLFQVFQRFHPKQAPGDGMGLAIAQLIVQRHGGRIWAESEEHTGTTFHVTLPVAAA